LLLYDSDVNGVIQDQMSETRDRGDATLGLSPWQLGLRRFKKSRLGVLSFCVVSFFVLVAIFAPIIVKLLNVDPYELDRSAINDY
jgi:peptide/nickel transport system permease protein